MPVVKKLLELFLKHQCQWLKQEDVMCHRIFLHMNSLWLWSGRRRYFFCDALHFLSLIFAWNSLFLWFQLLATGTEHFNAKPKKGIQYLQEHHLLLTPLDTSEVVHFLRENPRLDKKMIGEYISNRENLSVLDSFVKYVFVDVWWL